MHVTIRLFARLRELAGEPELTRQLPDGATASDAWHALAAEFPALDDYTRVVSCAVNEEYARLTATLKDGDEVAFLPPVSGGSGQSERAQRVSQTSGAGLRGPRERVCRGVRRGEAPR